MKTIRLTVDLTYDDAMMYGGETDPDPAGNGKRWFFEHVLGDELRLFSHLIGNDIGDVRVVHISEYPGEGAPAIEGTTKRLIKKFCASRYEERKIMRNPWRHGEYTYAMNGAICIRVAAHDWSVENEEFGASFAGTLNKILFNHAPLDDALYVPLRARYKSEIVRNATTAVKANKIGDVYINAKYIELIRQLPNARVRSLTVPGQPVGFIFADGVGAVMPISIPLNRY